MKRASPLLAALALLGSGCVEPVTLSPAPDTSPLDVGESRTVVLRFLRLDVKDFKKTLTIDDLKRLPPRTLKETWLLDMDATPLVENALRRIAFMPSEEAYALPQAAHNLFRLLDMTPENANLAGTPLEPLLGVGKAVAISPSTILEGLLLVGPNDRIAPLDITAGIVVKNVIGTHPNARFRQGPVTPDHPEGLYPVTPGALPVSLYDVATSFAGLSERYGPAPLDPRNPEGPRHPGFIAASAGLEAAGKDFLMTVKVSVNALPFKGLQAANTAVASVNSMGSQIEHAFDFSDPTWLSLEGLKQDLTIREMTMTLHEDPAFLPGGRSRAPLPTGDSPAWRAPPWEFERVLIETGKRVAERIPQHCMAYSPLGEVPEPLRAVDVCIDGTGWVDIRVDPSVELPAPPPAPSYFWDMLVEVAQARLHDGGLAEGQANVAIPLRDVPVGVSTDVLVQRIRENLQKDPQALRGMAEALTDSTEGDADFYYVQPAGSFDDWLFFVGPGDIRKNAEGDPVRSYAYRHPGFYADAALSQKVSSMEEVDGDTEHEKVRATPGARLFLEDAEGRRYEIAVGNKPSVHRISLTVTRIQ
jgi:hypothetical protein